MTEKTLTTENIKPALDALRGELAPWPVVAKKQDRLNTAQLNAANSGITSSLVAQIIANTAAIRALESAITGTGLRALVVASLPAVGTTGILYIVPVTTYDPDTDADVVNYSNEYIWIPVEGGQASEGHYEQVGQTGIVINNGQLTITVNGTSVGTFTANQSGDTTAAITVPTNADYVDRTTDQTVAGVKTFSSTINGTASKAIADEDGTSIKTGYVNVAGNQTVTGQKTWSGNQFFTSNLYAENTSYTLGTTPSDNVVLGNYYLTEATHSYVGLLRTVVYSNGRTVAEIRARNKFKNGALDTTGTNVTASLNIEIQPDGAKTLYFDSSIRNDVLPYTTNTYSLGSSNYQWSSVYAQTYYGYTMYFGAMSERVIRFQTNGSNNYKNYDTYIGTTYTQYDNTLAMHRSVGKCGDTTEGATTNDVDTSFSFFKAHIYHKTFDLVDAVKATNDGTENSLKPITTSVTDLGTSTNKWKTLNGVNPGALSLPDVSKSVTVDTTNYTWTGSDNAYVAPADGWLSLKTTTGLSGRLEGTTTGIGSIVEHSAGGRLVLLHIPVLKNESVTVSGVGSDFILKFYPCLGNV